MTVACHESPGFPRREKRSLTNLHDFLETQRGQFMRVGWKRSEVCSQTGGGEFCLSIFFLLSLFLNSFYFLLSTFLLLFLSFLSQALSSVGRSKVRHCVSIRKISKNTYNMYFDDGPG